MQADKKISEVEATVCRLLSLICSQVESGSSLFTSATGKPVKWLLSGGWVRDKMRGEKSKDMDIVVCQDAFEPVVECLEKRLETELKDLPHHIEGKEVRVVDRGNITGRKLKSVVVTVFEDQDKQQTKERVEVEIRDMGEGVDIKEDVVERDFTVNALFYNHADGKVIDLCGVGCGQQGRKDVKEGVLRTIGAVEETFRDARRLIRAVRFTVQKKMTMSEAVLEFVLSQGQSAIVLAADDRSDTRRKTSWPPSTGESWKTCRRWLATSASWSGSSCCSATTAKHLKLLPRKVLSTDQCCSCCRATKPSKRSSWLLAASWSRRESSRGASLSS